MPHDNNSKMCTPFTFSYMYASIISLQLNTFLCLHFESMFSTLLILLIMLVYTFYNIFKPIKTFLYVAVSLSRVSISCHFPLIRVFVVVVAVCLFFK